jgi:hypothetical protein
MFLRKRPLMRLVQKNATVVVATAEIGLQLAPISEHLALCELEIFITDGE